MKCDMCGDNFNVAYKKSWNECNKCTGKPRDDLDRARDILINHYEESEILGEVLAFYVDKEFSQIGDPIPDDDLWLARYREKMIMDMAIKLNRIKQIDAEIKRRHTSVNR